MIKFIAGKKKRRCVSAILALLLVLTSFAYPVSEAGAVGTATDCAVSSNQVADEGRQEAEGGEHGAANDMQGAVNVREEESGADQSGEVQQAEESTQSPAESGMETPGVTGEELPTQPQGTAAETEALPGGVNNPEEQKETEQEQTQATDQKQLSEEKKRADMEMEEDGADQQPQITSEELDAAWEEESEQKSEQFYTLTFDYNGGVDAQGRTFYQVQAKKGDLISDYMKQAEDQNFISPYIFTYKWDIYDTETGELYDDTSRNRTTAIKKTVKDNYLIKAVWSPSYATFVIRYELDGGSFDPYSEQHIPVSYTYADLVTLPKQVVKEGYLFQGFYKDAAFQSGVVQTIPVQSFGDVTLYARWESAAPKKTPALNKVTNPSKGKVKVTFKKMSGIAGLEMEMSTDPLFEENVNTMKLDPDAKSLQLTNMPQDQTYYFRLRSYNMDSLGERAYSEYSNVLSIDVKKGVAEYEATASSAQLKKCSVQKNVLTITYTVTKRIESSDDSYYLVALDPYTDKYLKQVEQTIKQKSVTFTLPLRDEYGNDLTQTKFALAIRKDTSYKLISSGAFIENPQAAASYTKAFPKTKTKKGLQMPQDEGLITDLGLKHTFLNIDLNHVLKGTNLKLYRYNGQVYHFNDPLGPTIAALNAKGITVTAQIMLTYDESTKYMIVGSGRTPGKKYYAINVKDKKARETFEAAMSFLAETYSTKTCHVDNWVIGNEVNTHSDWYYAGSISRKNFMKQYAGAFRIMYYAVKSHSKNARAYICLEHTWNDYNGIWGAKPFMEAFNKEIKAQQADIQWNLAYHAYSSELTNASVWKDDKAPDNTKANYVTPKNLDVLTKYVKKNFGKKTRIILSEQGFSSKKGTDLQAAALIYTYYKAEFNTMIDAVIFRSDIDNSVESAQGLYMGLKDINGTPKPSYEVFKYMDTAKAAKYTKPYLQTVGIKKWKKIAPGYTLTRFK